jgi:hypothetical protein
MGEGSSSGAGEMGTEKYARKPLLWNPTLDIHSH